MLRSVNEIRGYVLEAVDGDIGRCRDFLFDDEHWTIRYMVADTGRWLDDRKVLISPVSLGEALWRGHRLKVDLTRKEIEESPLLDSDAPVSRRHERRLLAHHGWPHYWAGDGIWGSTLPPSAFEGAREEAGPDEGDPHLRSIAEVSGYAVAARDGDLGHVSDFIINEGTWQIRFAVVKTGWLGRKVLIAPNWIRSVSWENRRVHTSLTGEEIKSSPAFP